MKPKVKWTKHYTARVQGETILFAEFFELNLLDHINRKKLVDMEIHVGKIRIAEGQPCVDLQVSWWVNV